LTRTLLNNLRIVLVAARNPLNIGAAARAMSNFGALYLRVVNPYSIAFHEARSAVGAADLLAGAQEFATLPEAVADCSLVVGTTALQHRELQHPLYRLEQGGELVRSTLPSGKVAIVFGSEKRGLSNDDLSHCHWLMRIPTRAAHGSMNLGQAVAVCLYELAREGRAAFSPEKPLATSADLERITQLLLGSLKAGGYIKRGSQSTTEEKVRRLVRRLNLSSEDAEVMQGMLRKIAWKLRKE
jgi:TrmH family RNA methyltransferase